MPEHGIRFICYFTSMKLLCSCLCLFILLFHPIDGSGQCPSNKYQWDLSVSYGLISTSQFAANNNTDGDKMIASSSGASFFTVRYFLFNRLAICASGGVSGEKGRYNDPYNPSFITSGYQLNTTTIAVELYYIYFFRKYLEVYTFAGAGPSFTTTETNINATTSIPASANTVSADIFKAQYTPIGIRLGGRLGGYAEVGYGYKGIFNFGISCKLGPACWWKNEFR